MEGLAVEVWESHSKLKTNKKSCKIVVRAKKKVLGQSCVNFCMVSQKNKLDDVSEVIQWNCSRT